MWLQGSKYSKEVTEWPLEYQLPTLTLSLVHKKEIYPVFVQYPSAPKHSSANITADYSASSTELHGAK